MNTVTAYDSVKKLIYQTCNSFREKYGGNSREYYSRANESFVTSIGEYDPSRSKLTTFISLRIYRDLLNERQKEARRHRLMPIVKKAVLETEEYRKRFILDDFLKELQPDGVVVVRLALQMSASGLQTCFVKRRVKKKLLTKGWDRKRIQEAFNEIEESLYEVANHRSR